MKAILLLAGRSERFWPLLQKSLFSVCGRSLLDYQIDHLRKGGCGEILLVGGAHNLKEIKEAYPDLPCIEQEDLTLGMRGALLSALPKIGQERCLVVSGNDVIDPAGYREVISKANSCDGAILARRVKRYFPGGYLTIQGDLVISILEKPGEGREPSDLVNIVAHVHNDPSSLLDALKKVRTKRDDGYEQALTLLCGEKTYKTAVYDGLWQPVKYPWHMLNLLPQLLSAIQEQQIAPGAQIHPTAILDGNIVLGSGSVVLPHAVIKGPSYVGKGVTIAQGALVRGSSIGDHSVIGYCTEVKGSIIGKHVWTHMNYIGDSILGNNVSLGAGTTTGNFRLDEQEITSVVCGEKIPTGLVKFGSVIGNNCRIGIHTGLNPGVKIGSGSFVSSGVLLEADSPDGSFVRMKSGEVEIRKNTSPIPQPQDRERFKMRGVC